MNTDAMITALKSMKLHGMAFAIAALVRHQQGRAFVLREYRNT